MSLLLTHKRSRLPDGPQALPVIGKNLEFARDPMNFLTTAHRTYGNLVTLPLNGQRVVAAFGPSEVEALVNSYGTDVDISMAGGLNVSLKSGGVQGRGPLNSSGAEHSFYRDLAARAMRGESALSYSSIVTEMTERMLDGWQAGTELDMMPAMNRFVHRVFKFYMFGRDVETEDPELDAAVDFYISVVESYRYRLGSTVFQRDVPGVSKRATLRRHMELIDDRVREIGAGTRPALRYSLARAFLEKLEGTDHENDAALVREAMLQMYFAGLTSVASTIVWTLLMLALHPDEARRQVEEARQALGGRVPGMTDMRLLPRLDAVLSESMRLYPGSAFEFKRVVGTLEVNGYTLAQGSPLLLAPWVTQRSTASFADPDTFDPDRFADKRKEYPKGAFAPWGYGSRSCIGKVLARCAITAVVGGLSQRYRLDLVPGQTIHPHCGVLGIRLLPRPGVRMAVNPQDGETERSAAALAGTVVGAVPGPF
jgi:cytochrome P450